MGKIRSKEENQKISISNLILFSLFLIGSKEGCSFERLLKECFDLFPKTLGLSQYPCWPDARKIDRPLRQLRKKGLIKGSSQNLFSLTKKGEGAAEELVKTLRQEKLFKN